MRRAAALSLLLLSACAPVPEPDLTVAAAASLAPVFNRLGPGFEASHGASLTFSYAATGSLAEQIRNGAPFDVFAAADARHVDRLIDDGLLQAGSRTVFAYGRLALASAPGSSFRPSAVADLANPAVRTIALANPLHAPYGLAGEQALERAGLAGQLAPRLVLAENVSQAGQMVLSGNADAALLAASTAVSLELEAVAVDPTLYDRVLHVAAAARDRTNAELAAEFLEYLLSPEAQSQLDGFGLRRVSD